MTKLAELINEIRKSKERIKRDAFLYLEPKDPKNQFAQCSTCRMWTGPESNTCTILGKTKVTGNMSCGLYAHGKPSLSLKGKEKESCTSQEAGLVNRQVRCENCRFFDNSICVLFKTLNESNPEIFDLEEKVNDWGCCNANMPKNE